MDKFASMRAFIGVVDAGNFSRAAEQLELPRPTVTRLVQQLEKELQIQLLHRTTRRMTVTEEGRRYYEGALQVVAEIDTLESDVAGARNRPRGNIRVDVPGTLASSVVIPALPDFFAQYPDIDIDLKIDNRSADLIERGIDCVIRIGSIVDDRLIARPLAELDFVTLASPIYLDTHGRPSHPHDLADSHTLVQVVSPRTGQPFRYTLSRGDERVSPCAGRTFGMPCGSRYYHNLRFARRTLFGIRRTRDRARRLGLRTPAGAGRLPRYANPGTTRAGVRGMGRDSVRLDRPLRYE